MNNNIDQYPEIHSIEKCNKLVVLIHGLGSDGHDLISLVPYIQKKLTSCHFISPHGNEPYDMAPYGRQWFSVSDRTPSVILKLAETNARIIEKLILEKQKKLSLTNKDTILIGFSQGSMIAVYLTLTTNNPYAATVAFSGRLIEPDHLLNKSTPICIIHGKDDDVVIANEAHILSQYFIDNNITHDKLIINNLTHSIDHKGLEFALNFLTKHVF